MRDHPDELCEELRYSLNSRTDFEHIRDCLLYTSEDAEFAARHEDLIRQKMLEYNVYDECNMAEYFHGNNGVSEKLRSADWDFERRNGELYGCLLYTSIRLKSERSLMRSLNQAATTAT